MSTKYAIVGGKLIDGTGAEPVENSLVLVDDNGKIEYAGAMQDLPEGVEVIDAAGKTVLPGLIDTHLHFSGNLTDDDTDWVMQPLLEKQAVAVKQAYDCLTHGLTTVCEIGRFGIQIRDCIDKGVFKGPRVLAPGLGFCRVAGHGDSHHCTQELNKESHPWGDQVDGPWDLRKAVRRRLRENPDAIKIWATGGGIWRWDSGRDQHYCSEEIQAVVEEAKMVGIPVWSHCYNNHAAAYDSVRFGCEQLIHGFDIDERTMDLMAEQGTFFTPTIAFLPTWYATYPPVYVPELHDKYEGTLVEKELQRNYDCLREAKKRGVVMTIGSDSFSFVTPYGTCSIEEMYEFVDKIGFTPVETITCATLNGAKMCHIEDETGSIEATGHKCLALPGKNGKITARQIRKAVEEHRANASHEHEVQPGMVYISNPTEVGTLYNKEELTDISAACYELGLYLFVDGARMAYGLTSPANDLSLQDYAALCDVFYLGGTKCGALFGEAVVITNDDLKPDFRYCLKQHGGMLAKGRLLGEQFLALLDGEDGSGSSLYFTMAKKADEQALRIRAAFEAKGCKVLHDSPTNQQFFVLPDEWYNKLAETYAMTHMGKPDKHHTAVRVCTSWATKDEAVEQLIADVNGL